MSDRPTLTRRSFLLAPALLPLAGMRREADLHHFTFDHVVGTSLDLDLWASSPAAAEQAAEASLDEIARMAAVLDTRDPDSEINRIAEGSTPSRDLGAVLAAYDSWTSRTNGVLSITPQGKGSARNVDALGKA